MSTRPALAGFAGLDQHAPAARRLPDREASVEMLPGVGPKVAQRLARLGLRTVGDIADYLPRAFLDWSEAGGFDQVLAGTEATVRCTIERIGVRPTRRRNLKIVQAGVRDDNGSRVTAVWFNQAWLVEQLPPGTRVLLHGRLEGGFGPPTFRVERHERDEGDAGLHTLGLVPVYPASEDVSTAKLRELTEAALRLARHWPDALPAEVRDAERLPLRADALLLAHRPERAEDAERARERLAFEELLVLLVGLARRRRGVEEGARAHALAAEDGALVAALRSSLPFELTPEQEAAIAAIRADLAHDRPMQRLLQGDVGSGKTVVALYALLRAVEAGHQGALMAPTETLAEQHFLTVEPLARELGVAAVLLTSSLGARALAEARDRVASGEAQLVVGTHALIQEGVAFHSLAVAVVDEQHRFGVEQRRTLSRPWPAEAPAGRSPAPPPPDAAAGTVPSGAVLHRTVPSGPAPAATPQERERARRERRAITGSGDSERAPHVLHMTATPIPRTLAQVVYGDLAVTEIARPPRGRRPVVTAWVAHERSGEAYRRLRRHLEEGRQAYVVCPLVSESEAVEARAAAEEAERLRSAELRGFRIGCLHGQLPAAERRATMDAFKRRELDVLVATTVIEVGVDVPNATIMIVQEADRFGLAQLHQLRGRVGRGAEQSYCLLVSRPRDELTENAQRRLQALVDTSDGFALAEVDLELRGEGELLGTRQSGLPELRFARLTRDRTLVERARAWAERLAADGEGPLTDEADRLFADADHRGLA